MRHLPLDQAKSVKMLDLFSGGWMFLKGIFVQTQYDICPLLILKEWKEKRKSSAQIPGRL